MPPLNVGGGVGTLRDSGIGDDYPTPSRHGASKDSSNVNLHRNGTDRSSFGMILKVTRLKEYIIPIDDSKQSRNINYIFLSCKNFSHRFTDPLNLRDSEELTALGSLLESGHRFVVHFIII